MEFRPMATPVRLTPELQKEFNLGNEHLNAQRWDEAVSIYRRLLTQRQDMPELHHDLGLALKSQGKLQEALEAFNAALALRIDIPEVYNSIGDVLRLLNRPEEAIAAFSRALSLNPKSPESYNNLGITLYTMGRTAQGIESFRRALLLRPTYPQAWNNLGNAMRESHRPAEAIVAYRKALELGGSRASAWSNYALVLKDTGQMSEAIDALDKAMELQPDFRLAHGNKLCMMHYHPGYAPATIHREARIWCDRYARPLAGEIPTHQNDPSPQRRLRIGYVSADFHHHCLALFLTPLLANHEHQAFEIFCYSNVSRPDAVTAKLRGYADAWRDITGSSDAEVAQIIRQDGIDILVDLALHTAGNRLLIFARKPAPIQVTWLGYPGTTGMDMIDYRLTDAQLDPPDLNEVLKGSGTASEACTHAQSAVSSSEQSSRANQDTADSLGSLAVPLERTPDQQPRAQDPRIGTKEEYYSERSVRLADCFWIFDPSGMELVAGDNKLEVSPLPARAAGHVTFGCLNNFCKVNDQTLAMFAKVMAAVPNSRVIFMAAAGPHRDRVAQKLGLREGERLEFVPYRARRAYLETYHRIDLCLDTLPYNGHTTSLDALWMGVPVVTIVGQTVVGRAGWTHLHNMGLMELVTRTEEQFVKLALELAGDLDRLAALRSTIRQRMEQSALMDGPGFVRNLEAIYRRMWQAWCASRNVDAPVAPMADSEL